MAGIYSITKEEIMEEILKAFSALNSIVGTNDDYGPVLEIFPDGSYDVMLPNSAIEDGYSSIDRANNYKNQHATEIVKAIKQWFDYHDIEYPK
jgi:hypothetical protein